MASVNRVVLVGNLTRDPELRFTPSGRPVTSFGIAVNRIPYTNDRGERVEGVDFLNVVVFGRQAETTHQYLSKGSPVAVDGRVRSRSWETDDGQRRYAVEIAAQNVQFLGRRSDAPVETDSGGTEDDLPSIEGIDEVPF